MSTNVPTEVAALAQARAEARGARDWPEADRLRTEIEAAGWKVVDQGTHYRLEPAHPPDIVEGPRVLHGSSGSVPSRLGDPATTEASVVLLATDWPDDLARSMAGLSAHGPAGTQIVIVADGPSPEQEAALLDEEGSPDQEIVWTSQRLGHATALNAGLHRVTGRIVVLLDTSIEPTGDIVTPLAATLDDPGVGIAGGFGVRTADLRHFDDAPAGDVDGVLGYCLAFRREDIVERGPLDEHFRYYRNLDLWWSLVLRDQGEAVAPRRAVAVDLPLVRHEHREWEATVEAERARLSKRNFYRLLDRFGRRTDLLREPAIR